MVIGQNIFGLVYFTFLIYFYAAFISVTKWLPPSYIFTEFVLRTLELKLDDLIIQQNINTATYIA